MAAKVYIKSFGCQMNVYDADRLADQLAAAGGLQRSADASEAKVIMLNTCSVREKAQEKLFDELGRLRARKEADPGVRIGVGGCVASQEGERILARAPYVDVIFGPQTIHRVPALLAERERTGKAQLDISFPGIAKFDELAAPGARGPRAFVSAMEGCSKYCSFCVVPYTRGPEVSRPLADVLDEVAMLALDGVREVTLLGQNVNAYLGREPGGAQASLARLLECVAALDGIERIRYTTSHPVNFGADLIAAHAQLPKLMPHVHLPVQSGSDRVLARMKRGHTLLEYKGILRKLRQANPDIAITSDFIVGFPGESRSQFAKTVELVAQADFDGGFSFIYSPRPGTPAASLPEQLERAEQTARLVELQAALAASFARRGRACVGQEVEVLVEGPAPKGGKLTGHAPNNRVVVFAGAGASVGDIRKVRIDAARGAALAGTIVD